MKIMDRYDFDEEGKERYIGTIFLIGKEEYLGKSHGVSYVSARKQLKEMGMVMGLEKEIKNDGDGK